ncbi:MAG: hypothetical protein ABW136_04020, partial [Steroidobacteraceae bacterium]
MRSNRRFPLARAALCFALSAGFAAAASAATSASNLTGLTVFGLASTDGTGPRGEAALGADGNFYL